MCETVDKIVFVIVIVAQAELFETVDNIVFIGKIDYHFVWNIFWIWRWTCKKTKCLAAPEWIADVDLKKNSTSNNAISLIYSEHVVGRTESRGRALSGRMPKE